VKVKKIALTAILTALAFVLYEFLVIKIPPTNPFLSLSLGIIPIFFIAYYCGILNAIIGAVVADLLGYFLVGASSSPFHPGFTFNALLSGLIFGFILHYKEKLDGKKGKTMIIIIEILITLITIPLFSYYFIKTDLGAGKGGISLLITIDIFAFLLNFSVILYMLLSSNSLGSNAIVLSYIVYLYIVSLCLTPLWVLSYTEGLNFFYFWLMRLITVPLQVIIYSLITKLILIPLSKISKVKKEEHTKIH